MAVPPTSGTWRRVAALALALALCGVARARTPRVEPPPADALPALAAGIAEALAGRVVDAPDGTEVAVVASDDRDGLLDADRIEAVLRSIAEAGAWPEAWVVVQVRAEPWDLIFRLRLDEDGAPVPPEPVFAAERRDWDVDLLRSAVRDATGRRPRGRSWNVVIQGFTQRIVRRWVYEPPAERRGLLAILPEGSVLREARSVDLGGAERHTLAVVLREAELVPSACDTCEARLAGHADTGRIFVVLAGESAVLDEREITALLAPPGGRPLLPRYACVAGDEDPGERARPAPARFEGRPPVPLLRLEDRDGDGRALEIALPTGGGACGAPARLSIAVEPDGPRLVVPAED